MFFKEPEEAEANPFRNYRHTASVVALPVFVSALLLLLASVQSVAGLWVWCAVGTAGAWAVLWVVGRWAVRRQRRRGNPHCATRIGRRYMLLVFISTGLGVLGTGCLVAGVLCGWIRLRIGVLFPAMVAALTVALSVAGIVWQTVGRNKSE
ncbi:MAG: hypothetical protein K2G93_08330 [Rikenella sp.]|nr:hypothetical protein [Rikenella sp.]